MHTLLLQSDILRCRHDETGEISRRRHCLDLQDIKIEIDGPLRIVHVQRHTGLVSLHLYNY